MIKLNSKYLKITSQYTCAGHVSTIVHVQLNITKISLKTITKIVIMRKDQELVQIVLLTTGVTIVNHYSLKKLLVIINHIA